MANESIELLKGYEPKKMQWPAFMSEKLDGVPVVITMKNGALFARTRQGEELHSIEHIIRELHDSSMQTGAFLVGELYIPGVPFKEISGKVRRHAPAPDLVFNIFDGNLRPDLYKRYAQRIVDIRDYLVPTNTVKVIPFRVVQSAFEAEHEFDFFMKCNPKAEGVVLHAFDKVWSPGKRCWGTQRMKPSPTLDLRVDRYYEAISESGEGLNMVGRIDVHYERHYEGDCHPVHSVVGVGPGAMSHAERRMVWAEAQQILNGGGPRRPLHPTIIEVKYMQDDTYDALRQPTFVRFRPDKDAGDVHHV